MAGLYVHIPFCKSRCVYCGFYSTTLLCHRQAYVDALCKEMLLRDKPPIDTIYIGGGTPSQLDTGQLRQLFDAITDSYAIAKDAEITMECNPDDVDIAFATTLASLPVNRVSMGIQTFDDQRLRLLCRRHTASQAIEAVRHLREVGISNISIDLMFAFPNQTLEKFDDDIRQALSLGVEHISSYGLTIEEGTPLHKMMQRGDLSTVDEDLYADMYTLLADRLQEAGYEHYEISNFALPGYRSRHNTSYWTDVPYLGIGAAAHSYYHAGRQWNISDIGKYISAINAGQIPSEREVLSPYDHYNDLITTALRTSWGISIERVKQQYGTEFSQYLEDQAGRWVKTGHLVKDDGWLRLSLKGIIVSDSIMSDLIRV